MNNTCSDFSINLAMNTATETPPEMSDSHQNTLDAMKIDESITQDQPPVGAESTAEALSKSDNSHQITTDATSAQQPDLELQAAVGAESTPTSVEEEQISPTDETPIPKAPDKEPAP